MTTLLVREMLAAYVAGDPISDILNRFGVSYTTLSAHRRRHGLKLRRQRRPPPTAKQVAAKAAPVRRLVEVEPQPFTLPPVAPVEGLFVCRRRKSDAAVIVREAREGETGVSCTEAFRQAKKAARWLREIPAAEEAQEDAREQFLDLAGRAGEGEADALRQLAQARDEFLAEVAR